MKENNNFSKNYKNARKNENDISNININLENENQYFGQDVGLGSSNQNIQRESAKITNNQSDPPSKEKQNKIYVNRKKSDESTEQNTQIERTESKKKKSKKKPKKKLTFFGLVFRILFGLIGTILTFAITISLVLYFKFNVNIIETGMQVYSLQKSVDIDSKFKNQFSDDDYNLYSGKLNNFDTNFDALLFSDKEIASFINYSIAQTKSTNQSNGDVSVSPTNFDLVKELDLKLIQIDFSNTYSSENIGHLTDMNFVISLTSSKLKEKYFSDKFYSGLANLLPDVIYVSGDVEILTETDGSKLFDYKVVYKSVVLNNLTKENSEKFINSLNKFVKIGTAKEFTEMMGKTFADAIIGNSSTLGLYSTLQGYGAKGYSFYTNENVDYFIIFSHKTTEQATITYENLKNAENSNPTSYTVLDRTIVLEDLTADGYNFLGFYDSEVSGERIYNINTWKLENRTIYARFEPITYTIEYVLRGGKALSELPKTYTIEDEFTLSNAFKTNETPFLGWTGTTAESKTLNLVVNRGTFGNLTFYAWFDDDERSLSLYADGKKLAEMIIVIGMPIEKSEVERVFDLSKLGLSGYSYTNWFTESELSNEFDFSILVSGDVNLYTKLNYVVSTNKFYPYISKFEQSMISKTLTVGSREELTAYIEFVQFYDKSEQVAVNLSYVSSQKQLDTEFSQARKDAFSNSNTFRTGSTFSFTNYSSSGKFYVMYFVSSSSLDTDATLSTENGENVVSKNYDYILSQKNEFLRDENFDDFKINNVPNCLEVKTSNQLVYCLEQGYKPICESGSSAEKMYNMAKAVLRSICNDEMTDIEKLKAIYEWLIQNVNYDKKALEKSFEVSSLEIKKYDAWYLEGVFNNRTAVCEGYAKALLVMAKIEGIPAIFATGNSHAWNKVMVGENWYGIDATHGDVEITDRAVLSYEQFMFSDNYKKSLGYTTSDYEEIQAITERSFYSNQIIETDGTKFSLYVKNSDEVSLIAEYVKKLSLSQDLTSFSFDFEVDSTVSTEKVISAIASSLGYSKIKYIYDEKNALIDHYVIIVDYS